MTNYSNLEESLDEGQPLRCYEFARGPLRWAYTTHTEDVAYLNQDYASVRGLSDDGLRSTGQATADALNITMPRSLDLPQLWWGGSRPGSTVSLTIHDLQWDDTLNRLVGIVAWVGQVTDVQFTARDRCKVVCQNLSALLDREGLRLTFQRDCPHCIYDHNCRVPMAQFASSGTIITLNGQTVTVAGDAAAYANGWFTGGWLEWEVAEGLIDARGIESHLGAALVVIGGTSALAIGQVVTLYAGCDNTWSSCLDKFSNHLNNGGCKDMPGESPFDGNPVF